MSREDFGRSPIARQPWEFDEIIPAIPDHPYQDDNSPLADREVGKFDALKSDQMKRSMAFDFLRGTGEFRVLAFFNHVTIPHLAEFLKTARKEYGAENIKSMSLLLDVESSKEMSCELAANGFVRDESRDQPLYRTFVNPLVVRKRAQKPKAVVVEPPKPELKATMGPDEFAQKQRDLDALRAKITALESARTSDVTS